MCVYFSIRHGLCFRWPKSSHPVAWRDGKLGNRHQPDNTLCRVCRGRSEPVNAGIDEQEIGERPGIMRHNRTTGVVW